MTAQEVFDIVVPNLRKQGKRSTTDPETDVCVYRGPGGLKCAAGWVIPDDLYKREMEGHRFLEIYMANSFLKARLGLDEGTQYLVAHLQSIHDLFRPQFWEEQFEETAKSYGLTLPPVSA